MIVIPAVVVACNCIRMLLPAVDLLWRPPFLTRLGVRSPRSWPLGNHSHTKKSLEKLVVDWFSLVVLEVITVS